MSEWATVQGPQSLLIQGMDDLGLSLSANVPLKHLPDDGSTLWVDLELLVRSGTITERAIAAGALALRGTDPQAPADVLGELEGVILRHALQHAFQNDAFRGVRDAFGGVYDFDAVLLAAVLVERDLFLVAPHAVHFPEDQYSGAQSFQFPQHQLELVPVVVGAGHGPVRVFLDDGVAIGLGPALRLGPLALDGLLPLAVAGIAVVGDGRPVVVLHHFHVAKPPILL